MKFQNCLWRRKTGATGVEVVLLIALIVTTSMLCWSGFSAVGDTCASVKMPTAGAVEVDSPAGRAEAAAGQQGHSQAVGVYGVRDGPDGEYAREAGAGTGEADGRAR